MVKTGVVEKDTSKGKYFEAVGRRKTAVARVRFYPGAAFSFRVNNKDHKKYFALNRLWAIAEAPITKSSVKGGVEVKVKGGGTVAQSEAITLGLARAMVKFDPELKKEFRVRGYMTRDARMIERKKYGLKKARRAPQWRKR